MTLIVGIQCEDGCVVAADGAATLGVMGTQTARQPVRKLQVIGGRMILGVSGPVGLGQLLSDRLNDLHGAKQFSGAKCPSIEGAMRILREKFWEDVGPAIEQAKVAAGLIGNAAALSAIATCVVALKINHRHGLIQLDQQCAPEVSTDSLPFVAIGSGQPMADPFLAFLRSVFWRDRLPTLAEGTLAAVWTVQHGIDTMPGGVADPMQVMQLTAEGTVVELSEGELLEHRHAVSAALDHLRKFPAMLGGGTPGAADVVAPPEPPA